MNPTESPARRSAGALFDSHVVALAQSRKSQGRQEYFPLRGEDGSASYFDEPTVRVMAPADFEFPGGGTAEGLVDALVSSWTAEGQDGLAAMDDGLKAIAAELSLEPTRGNGEVSILCYTLF